MEEECLADCDEQVEEEETGAMIGPFSSSPVDSSIVWATTRLRD